MSKYLEQTSKYLSEIYLTQQQKAGASNANEQPFLQELFPEGSRAPKELPQEQQAPVSRSDIMSNQSLYPHQNNEPYLHDEVFHYEVLIKNGGAHTKYFESPKYGWGYVIGDIEKKKDAKKEKAVELYARSIDNNKPYMTQFEGIEYSDNYISTQEKINANDISQDPVLQAVLAKNPEYQDRIYKFPLNNKDGVRYVRLDEYVQLISNNSKISAEEKINLTKQLCNSLFETMKYLLQHNIGNKDLHAENMKVSLKQDGKINSIVAFDWGKSSLEDRYKSVDTLRFLLNKGVTFKKKMNISLTSLLMRLLGLFAISSRRLEKNLAKNVPLASFLSLLYDGNILQGYKEFGKFKKLFILGHTKEIESVISSNSHQKQEKDQICGALLNTLRDQCINYIDSKPQNSVKIYAENLAKRCKNGEKKALQIYAAQLLYLYLKKTYGAANAKQKVNKLNIELSKDDWDFVSNNTFDTGLRRFSAIPHHFKLFANSMYDINDNNKVNVQDLSASIWDEKLYKTTSYLIAKFVENYEQESKKNFVKMFNDFLVDQVFDKSITSKSQYHKIEGSQVIDDLQFVNFPFMNLQEQDQETLKFFNITTQELDDNTNIQLQRCIINDVTIFKLTKEGTTEYFLSKNCPYKKNLDVFLHHQLIKQESDVTECSAKFRNKYFPEAKSVKRAIFETDPGIRIYFVTYLVNGEELKYYYIFKKPELFRDKFCSIFDPFKNQSILDDQKKREAGSFARIEVVKLNSDKTDITIESNVAMSRPASAKIVIMHKPFAFDSKAEEGKNEIASMPQPAIFLGYSTNYNKSGEEHISINENNIFKVFMNKKGIIKACRDGLDSKINTLNNEAENDSENDDKNERINFYWQVKHKYEQSNVAPDNLEEEKRTILTKLNELKQRRKLSYNPVNPLPKEIRDLLCDCRFDKSFGSPSAKKIWWGTMDYLNKDKSWYRFQDPNENDINLKNMDAQERHKLLIYSLRAQLLCMKSGYVYSDFDCKNTFYHYKNNKITGMKFIDVESMCTTEAMKLIIPNKLQTGNVKNFFEESEVKYWSDDKDEQDNLRLKFRAAQRFLNYLICDFTDEEREQKINNYIKELDNLLLSENPEQDIVNFLKSCPQKICFYDTLQKEDIINVKD